jgi:hypothetical protein
MLGFVDESIQVSARLYVLSVALVLPQREESLRADLPRLLKPRQRKFHWRDESEQQRQRMLQWIASARGLALKTYVCDDLDGRKQDRARRRCMRSLLWDLTGRGVSALTFESRQPHNDQRDRRLILASQKAGQAPLGLRYDFAKPVDEPLLWIPDAVSCCTATHLREGTYAEHIAYLGVPTRV